MRYLPLLALCASLTALDQQSYELLGLGGLELAYSTGEGHFRLGDLSADWDSCQQWAIGYGLHMPVNRHMDWIGGMGMLFERNTYETTTILVDHVAWGGYGQFGAAFYVLRDGGVKPVNLALEPWMRAHLSWHDATLRGVPYNTALYDNLINHERWGFDVGVDLRLLLGSRFSMGLGLAQSFWVSDQEEVDLGTSSATPLPFNADQTWLRFTVQAYF